MVLNNTISVDYNFVYVFPYLILFDFHKVKTLNFKKTNQMFNYMFYDSLPTTEL